MGILSGLLGGLAGALTGPIGPALIGAASTLGGAAMSRPKNQYVVPDYAGIRAAAEAAGFNPLTALQMAPGQVVQSQNYMGQAALDASLTLLGGLAKNKAAMKVDRLQQANDTLVRKVQNLTLRPKVGGVYAQRQATPSLRRALGVSDASSAGNRPPVDGSAASGGVSDSGLRPLSGSLAADPRRPVDNQPLKTTAGVMTIDTPYWPTPLHVPTLDGDEALQWYDLPSVAIYGAANAAALFNKQYWEKQARINAPKPYVARAPLSASDALRAAGSGLYRSDDAGAAEAHLRWINRHAFGRGKRPSMNGRDYQRYN